MKCMVLSSGGVDSTTCIALAIEKYGKENVDTVAIYYGQILDKELECARKIAEYYDVGYYEFDLAPIFKYSKCSLIKDSGTDVCNDSYDTQCVPFRNGLMLSTVATLAQSLYPTEECVILLGNHISTTGYADCSIPFVESISKAINIGTNGLVSVESPLCHIPKSGVVKEGLRLGVPYEYTWSCYEGKDKACGKCFACLDRRQAFIENGVEDPIEYED